ncbi:hypothetical protein JW851_03045 [Candidatus Woesearchaeota archaeon]|nr:hypothetical protein [Candidatus Woesearchaeota archaeon]
MNLPSDLSELSTHELYDFLEREESKDQKIYELPGSENLCKMDSLLSELSSSSYHKLAWGLKRKNENLRRLALFRRIVKSGKKALEENFPEFDEIEKRVQEAYRYLKPFEKRRMYPDFESIYSAHKDALERSKEEEKNEEEIALNEASFFS